MAQKAEDFNLPISAISKIVKEAIPEGVQVTDTAKVALSKAASVFILYSTSSANSYSHNANRKRILAKDVFDALKEMKLEFLNHPLSTALAAHKNSLETKKQMKDSKRSSTAREDTDENMEVVTVPDEGFDIITLDSESGESASGDNEEGDDSGDSVIEE